MACRSIQINPVVAIRLYFETAELSTSDIQSMLREKTSRATITALKARARKVMKDEGVDSFSTNCVNTVCAFKAWNIDIESLVKKQKQKQELLSNDVPQCGDLESGFETDI